MTIAVPSAIGLLSIVPINPNAVNAVNAANGMITVTVTTTVGLVTETYVLLSTTTVTA
jgi:hypothetical protein